MCCESLHEHFRAKIWSLRTLRTSTYEHHEQMPVPSHCSIILQRSIATGYLHWHFSIWVSHRRFSLLSGHNC